MSQWCSIPGCNKRAKGRGMCSTHYERWRLYGDPLIKHKGGFKKESKGTYLKVRIDGRRLLKHRWVMTVELGRELLPKEEVHHKNGDLTDNRLENLELLPNHHAHMKLHRKKPE